MSLYLTPADVTRTTGRTRYSAQCRALDAMGIRYAIGIGGYPVVAASELGRWATGQPAMSPAREKRRALQW